MCYIRNIILRGLTTKKRSSDDWGDFPKVELKEPSLTFNTKPPILNLQGLGSRGFKFKGFEG